MATVTGFGLSALLVVFVWWASTGVIFYLNGLPERTYGWSLLGAGALAVVAMGAILSTLGGATAADAWVAFTAAIAVWAFIEMAFLMGVVTGPRKTVCDSAFGTSERFRQSVQVIAYHEVALLAVLMALIAVSQGAANAVAAWTFGVLWLMRISTKFNIFLGVPNTTADLLPARIAYLKTYFRQAPMNALFPVSITLATAGTIWLGARSMAVGGTAVEETGFAALATLAALGLIEHWFLVIPVPVERLWGLQSHNGAARGETFAAEPAERQKAIVGGGGQVFGFRSRGAASGIEPACVPARDG